MAAVPVTLDGVLYDLHNKTTQRVVIIADASLSGLGVGGGPIVPPPNGGGGGGQPPNYPNIPPHPAFPIAGGPGSGFPDKPGYPPVVGGGPIEPPDNPPPIDPSTPPIEWKVIWTPNDGWAVVGVPNVPHPAPSN